MHISIFDTCWILFRILGGLLSAHLLIIDKHHNLGDVQLEEYDNELLEMAHDLASRLLPAFENTKTGIPHPRVSWKCLNSPTHTETMDYFIGFLCIFEWSLGASNQWCSSHGNHGNLYCWCGYAPCGVRNSESPYQRPYL